MADEKKVMITVPEGRVFVVNGNGHGPGTYEVSADVAQALVNQGASAAEMSPATITPPTQANQAEADSRARALEDQFKQPVVEANVEPTGLQDAEGNVQPPVTPITAPVENTLAVSETGELPNDFAGIEALRAAGLSTFESLNGVDIDTVPGLSVDQAQAIKAVFSGKPAEEPATDLPSVSPNFDVYSPDATLPAEFPHSAELAEKGIKTFGDFRRAWANLAEETGFDPDVLAEIKRSATGEPAVESEAEPEKKTFDSRGLTGPLPEDMPGESALAAAGFSTWESIQGIDFADVSGIGDVRAAQIDAWAANGGKKPEGE